MTRPPMMESPGNQEAAAGTSSVVPANCIICGPTSARIFLAGVEDRLGVVQTKFTYVQCPRCELVFLHPLPTFADTEAFYPKAFWRTSEKGSTSSLPATKRFERWFRNRLMLADFRSIRRFFGPGTRHLDVGCATGDFIALVQSTTGCKSIGIELSPETAAYCVEVRGINAVSGDLVSHDFGEIKFDVITYNGVLEHLPNPYEHLERCSQLLAPGGMLLIRSLPNVRSFGFRLAGANWVGLDTPRHIYLFTRDSLIALLEKTGFRAIHVDFESPRHNPAALVASMFPELHRHRFDLYEAQHGRNPVARKVLLMVLLHIVRPLDWLLSKCGWGEVINVVAERDDGRH